MNKILSENDVTNCIAIEGGTALHLIDGIPYKNVSFKTNKKSYNVYYENNEIIQKPFSMLQL